MIIIGVDYHPSDQYIAFADTETGECGEQRLGNWQREQRACEWGSKPPAIHAGSSDYWQS
jgi:hypothetical protein